MQRSATVWHVSTEGPLEGWRGGNSAAQLTIACGNVAAHSASDDERDTGPRNNKGKAAGKTACV